MPPTPSGPCRTCKGKGYVWAEHPKEDPPGSGRIRKAKVKESCPGCGGSGERS